MNLHREPLQQVLGLTPQQMQCPVGQNGEPQISPAAEAARILEKHIQDQLLDTNAVNMLRNAIFESALLGTGLLKALLIFIKSHQWQRQGAAEIVYTPSETIVPRVEYVSCWDFHLIHLQQTSRTVSM